VFYWLEGDIGNERIYIILFLAIRSELMGTEILEVLDDLLAFIDGYGNVQPVEIRSNTQGGTYCVYLIELFN
jgi:hypothetical protein